ncbi:MAG: vitamin K epoxide reductase family protein [Chloroflexota bacterium]|nr:vitamin K epoxide reductase family protein [Chloroflexota bacterium]
MTIQRPRSPLWIAATTVAVAGVILSAYLTWTHFDAGALVCGLGDCHTVQASEFATVGPVPVALLGLAMYGTVLAGNVVARVRPSLAFAALSIAFAAALGGTVFASYLTWLKVAVIGAICQWCVVSATLTVLLTISHGGVVWQALAMSPVAESETIAADAASLKADSPGRGPLGLGGNGPRTVS